MNFTSHVASRVTHINSVTRCDAKRLVYCKKMYMKFVSKNRMSFVFMQIRKYGTDKVLLYIFLLPKCSPWCWKAEVRRESVRVQAFTFPPLKGLTFTQLIPAVWPLSILLSLTPHRHLLAVWVCITPSVCLPFSLSLLPSSRNMQAWNVNHCRRGILKAMLQWWWWWW